MSESDEDVTVDADGVSIRKSLNDHQFETLAVVFDIRSGREHAASVTLSESIPEGVEVDDIGFHPEYGGEHWRAEDGEVIFSRTFEPGEQYTTVYGVRDFDDERASLLAEPSLVVDETAVGGGIEDIDDLVSEEDSDIVREVISGERDTLPGLEDETEEAVEEPEAAEALAGANDGPAEAEATGDADDEPLAAEPAGEQAPEADVGEPDVEEPDEEPADADDEVGEAEVAEPVGGPALADDDVSDGPAVDEPVGGPALPDDDVLDEPNVAEPLGGPALADDVPGDEEPESADGLAATGEDDHPEEPDVADEDEEPLDAAGTDDQVEEAEPEVTMIEEQATDDAETPEQPADEITVPVTGGIARVLAKELRAGNVSYEDRRLLREELLPADGSTDARIQRLQTQMADLEAYTGALEQFLDEEGGAEAVMDDFEAKVDTLAGDLANVEDALSGVEDTVGAVEENVSEVADGVDDVEDGLHGVSADVDAVSETVEGLERDVESIEADLDRVDALDQRLQSVEDDVSAIHAELEELATFRDRLSSVFGPGGSGGSEAGSDDDEGYGGY